jgi:NAD(P)-dependent dehydrogenase (short-subunit alcohol dehydrogenase family)
VEKVHVDLGDTASIDRALEAVPEPVDALFSCAGVADGTPNLEKINFLGHRYMIDRMLERGQLRRGSAIGFIASAAGLGWERNLEEIREYLAIDDVETASEWARARNKADYMSSKQAICAYVASEATRLLQQGIRINAICPGPTDTPLAQANKEMWLGFGADYRDAVGIAAATPMEQAYPLVFLGSDAAVGITGLIMVTDAGYMSAGITGSFPAATDAANFLLGRY